MASKQEEAEEFYPKTRAEWRKWLEKHHAEKTAVWVIGYKKNAGKPSVSWTDVVEEALCFGWIDGKRQSVNSESYRQFVCRRKPKGTWSKINKAKIEELIKEGRMTPAGLEVIERAKENGSWTILDKIEELEVPADLQKEFKKHKGAEAFFDGLSKSVRKMMLYWIDSAKRPETREKRIAEVVEAAVQGKKPKQF